MRTYKRAEVTLNAVFGVPFGNIDCNTAFFISGSTLRECAVSGIDKGGNRKLVALLCVDGLKDLIDEVNNLGTALKLGSCDFRIDCVSPISRNVNFDDCVCAGFDGGIVHVDDSFALLDKGLISSLLHIFNCLVSRNDVCKLEERGLQDGIGSAAETELTCNGDSVNDIEVYLFTCYISLDLCRELFGEFLGSPLAVKQECAALLEILGYVIEVNVSGVVASNEICLRNKISGTDGLITEAEV